MQTIHICAQTPRSKLDIPIARMIAEAYVAQLKEQIPEEQIVLYRPFEKPTQCAHFCHTDPTSAIFLVIKCKSVEERYGRRGADDYAKFVQLRPILHSSTFDQSSLPQEMFEALDFALTGLPNRPLWDISSYQSEYMLVKRAISPLVLNFGTYHTQKDLDTVKASVSCFASSFVRTIRNRIAPLNPKPVATQKGGAAA